MKNEDKTLQMVLMRFDAGSTEAKALKEVLRFVRKEIVAARTTWHCAGLPELGFSW